MMANARSPTTLSCDSALSILTLDDSQQMSHPPAHKLAEIDCAASDASDQPASVATSTAAANATVSSVRSSDTLLPCPKYRLATECVFIEPTGVRDAYNAASIPIYQTATFKQAGVSEMGEYDYSRSGNPTRSHLEAHLAKLMRGRRALAVSSGMGALDIITRLVKTGEEIVAGDDIYGGTNRLLTFLHTHNNITVHHVDTTRVESIVPVLSQSTRLVLLETPTNPLIKIADIPSIARVVHENCPNALVVVDNTMMSPYLQNPLELGADIVYHSGTKYLSGHHDLMAGVVGVKDESLGNQLYFIVNAAGCGLAPFDCFLLLRGIKTLSVRIERQQASAIRIAQYLEDKGFKVRYPGLASHPQYQLHSSMSRGPGAVLSFETGSIEKSERVVESTRLFAISVSFGCVNSLISMPCRMSHASIPAHIRKQRALPEDLIRLCIGIEDVEDLIEDLDRALQLAGCIPVRGDPPVALVSPDAVASLAGIAEEANTEL